MVSELVSDAAAAGCLVETFLTSAGDFVAVTRGHQFENLAPRRAAVNAVCSLWHLVATAGMGASVGGRHERLAAPDAGQFWQCLGFTR